MGCIKLQTACHDDLSNCSSGKAGGFLALDWNDGTPVGPLARHSYALHAQLADTFGRDNIGYREVDTIQVRQHAHIQDVPVEQEPR